jgi:hypothetical protein
MEQSTKDDDILEMVVFRSENSKRVAGSPNQLGIVSPFTPVPISALDLIGGSLCVCHCGASLLACGRDFQLRC